jgi:ribosome biogenesis GTPase
VEDTSDYLTEARSISPLAEAVALNAKDPSSLDTLRAWCGLGQTVALVGSSGVGKSTLINGLSGAEQATRDIRDDDAKGRHTTTARSLHRIEGGGWLVDTPGVRELGMFDAAAGIDTLFDDVVSLAAECRFHDCVHEAEPGCAVQAAIASGALEPSRLTRWRKLRSEDRLNTETIAQTRARGKRFVKMARSAQRVKHRPKE